MDADWADALLRRRAEELARLPATVGDAAPAVPLLVGHGAEGRYGVPLRHLARVMPMPRMARVPGGPAALLGLIAIDGRVMRVLDVDRLCGVASSYAGGYALVLRGGPRPLALRLRTVDTVTELEPGAAAAPPEAGRFIESFIGDRIAVLDVAAILDTLGSTGEE